MSKTTSFRGHLHDGRRSIGASESLGGKMRGRGVSWRRPRLRNGKHRRGINQGVSLSGSTTQSTGGIVSTGVGFVGPEEATRGRGAAGPVRGRLQERMLVREMG